MARRKHRRRSQFGEPTRRDFVAIAGMLCEHGASPGLKRAFASHFVRENPRFQAERFMQATEKCKR